MVGPKKFSQKSSREWKTEATKTRGGTNTATPTTEAQFRVMYIIGMQGATGVDGAFDLDTSDSRVTNFVFKCCHSCSAMKNLELL